MNLPIRTRVLKSAAQFTVFGSAPKSQLLAQRTRRDINPITGHELVVGRRVASLGRNHLPRVSRWLESRWADIAPRCLPCGSRCNSDDFSHFFFQDILQNLLTVFLAAQQ